MKIIIAFVLFASHVASQNYCDRELCTRKTSDGRSYSKRHIGCGNYGGFSSNCPRERAIVPITKAMANLILQLHNEFRLQIATGRIRGYTQADQMIEVSWNNELARLAELHVKTCTFAHDECRSTERFSRPGQNIGITTVTMRDYKDVADIIRNHTTEWFIEYKQCDMSFIRSYRESYAMIGHFTQLVLAGADRVGCAMSKFDDGYRKSMMFTCNYSLGNLSGKPVYITGRPCSKCKSGCSNTYPGLCNTNEKNSWTKDERIQETTG